MDGNEIDASRTDPGATGATGGVESKAREAATPAAPSGCVPSAGDPGAQSRDADEEPPAGAAVSGRAPWGGSPQGGRRTVRLEDLEERRHFSPQQRLLLLDTWMRSKLPATEFGSLVDVTPTTLYQWRKRFEASGPAGLSDKVGGRRTGSQLPEPTRRAILMLKEAHPDWGQDRLHDVLLRSEGYGASPGAIARVLEEEGYVVVEGPTSPHDGTCQRG